MQFHRERDLLPSFYLQQQLYSKGRYTAILYLLQVLLPYVSSKL